MGKKKYSVSGIGNAIVDIQVEVTFDEFKSYGLEAGSMNLVDKEAFEIITGRLEGRDLKVSSGGSGANTCVALANLGNSVSYGCIVGDDSFGRSYEVELRDLGVELYNKTVKDAITGRSLLMITPDAERTMNTYLGITQSFGADHVSEEIIAQSEWIYLEGYLFSTPEGRSAIEKAVAIALNSNTKIAVTCSDGFIVDFFKEHVLEVCKQSQIIFANRNEALKLTSETTEGAALSALRKMAPLAVVTLSDKGAVASSPEGEVCLDSFKVKAVDDTGAGDMFAAGFLDSHLKGRSLKESVLRGSFLASQVVSQFGARLSGNLEELMSNSKALGESLG